MFTRCGKCRKKIEFGKSLCDECFSKVNKANKKNLKNKDAEKHTKTSKWQSIRRKALQRDKGLCQLCLTRGVIWNKKLEVHHIKKIATDEGWEARLDYDGLLGVCIIHHKEIEKLNLKSKKEIFDFYSKK